MSEETTPENLPRQLGRWDIAGVLARRAFSTVFLARAADSRPVVLKLLARSLMAKTELVPRFLAAARIAADIRHPNLVGIQEIGQHNDQPFFVMDFVAGETLASVLGQLHSRGEKLDPALVAFIIAEAAAALDTAHKLGLFHDHLTP